MPSQPYWHEEARSDPVEKTKHPNYRQWKTEGDPIAKDSLKFLYSIESLQQLRIEVYRVKEGGQELSNLEAQGFIGCAEVAIPSILSKNKAFAQHDGWHFKDLQSLSFEPGAVGRLALLCREEFTCKSYAAIDIISEKVRKPEFWKLRGDPYVIFNRTDAYKQTAKRDGKQFVNVEDEVKKAPQRVPLFRTEVLRRTNRPHWDGIVLSVPTLCRGVGNLLVEAEVRDWSRVGEHRLIGHCTFCFDDVQKAFRDNKVLWLHLGRPPQQMCPRRIHREEKELRQALQEFAAEEEDTGDDPDRFKSVHMGKQHAFARGNYPGTPGTRQRGGWLQRILDRLPRYGYESGLAFEPLGARSATVGKDLVHGGHKVEGEAMGSIGMSVGIGRMHTIYDYIRGGLELKLCVGIDFTRSNGGPDTSSSHHRYQGNGPNDYLVAMRMVAEVVEQFDGDMKHPLYGFGAKLPPSYPAAVSDCFALNGDFFWPMVTGIKGLEEAYQKALHVVHLHGPTRLREVIRVATLWAQAHKDVHQVKDNDIDMRWWLCLILTDGQITDVYEACDEIVKASTFPISFLVIGIGQGKFTFLENLDREVRQLVRLANRKAPDTHLERKMVHFARFDDYRFRPSEELMLDLIGDIPALVINYFQWLDIKPWHMDIFEDEVGQPLAVPIVEYPMTEDPQEKKDEKSERSTTKLTEASGSSGAQTGSRELRSESKGSVEGEDALDRMLRKQNELSHTLPGFLVEWRDNLLESCKHVGYRPEQIVRVIKEGVPDGSASALLDTVLHGGYGKRPIFKDMVKEVDLEEEARRWAMEELLRATANQTIDMPALPDGEPANLSPTDDQQEIVSGRSEQSGESADAKLAVSRYEQRRSSTKSDSGSDSTDTSVNHPSRHTRHGSVVEVGPETTLRVSTKDSIGSQESSRRPSCLRVGSKDSIGSQDSPHSSHRPSCLRIGTKDTMESRDSSRTGHKRARILDEAGDARLPGIVDAESGTCRVCMELLINTELQPCGHRLACQLCAKQLGICPMCRQQILDINILSDLLS